MTTPTTHRDPQWLEWARELQALAQTGLTFAETPYDRDRYERLRALSAAMYAAHGDAPVDAIVGMFAGQAGYATPKVDVRIAVFDADDRILMVREVSDGDRWTLPGGWADVNLTAAENAVREVREETGYDVAITKLAAAWDRTRQGHDIGVFSCVKLFFLARVTGGAAATSDETSEVRWFTHADLPTDLSRARTLPGQVARMFEHHRRPDLPTDFD